MKKIVLSIATATLLTFNFSGCVNSGLAVGTTGQTEVSKEFKKGYVTSTKKVLVKKSATAVLTGATVGAVAGGISDKSVPGAAVGAVVGAAVGYVGGLIANNNEVEAFATTIKSGNKSYTAYLEKQLIDNTNLEFVVRENKKVTNVNILTDVNNDELVDAIDKRYFENGYWNYHLQKEGITVKSKKKYYYLNDLVKVEFDKNYIITDIKKLKSAVISKQSKPITKVIYKDRVIEKEVIKEVKVPVPVEPIKKEKVSNDTTVAKVETKTTEPVKEQDLEKQEPKSNFW
jgi:uncharacterized membrane protein